MPLIPLVPANYNHGRTKEHAFYNILGGPKTHAKSVILNKCCILIGMKWQCISSPNKGLPISPKSFTKYLGAIFHEFKTKKGFQYDFKTDFDEKGQFHGVMIAKWYKLWKTDPTFGTQKFHAQFDWEVDAKIWKAIENGKVKPFECPEHLQLVVLYVLRRMFILHECKEIANLNHYDTYEGVYSREMGEVAGNEYEAFVFQNPRQTSWTWRIMKPWPKKINPLNSWRIHKI